LQSTTFPGSDVADWTIVGEASDGLEAIDLATKLRPNLILLDYSMPKMNGIEIASVLKKKLSKVHIVVFTIFDGAVSSRVSFAAGVDLVVPKADGLNGLVKAVHHLMGTTGMIEEDKGATAQD
jgi:DNA-binding NarL/FixJ family response regulator